MTSREPIIEELDLPDATVIRVHVRELTAEGDVAVVKDALCRRIETGCRRIILNLSEVEWISSSVIGMLCQVRKGVPHRARVFQPPSKRGTIFPIFRDESEALETVRQGETDCLVLCGGHAVREVFTVCGVQFAERQDQTGER